MPAGLRFIIECRLYVAAIFFFLYLFVYLWTSEGGPTLLAMTLVPVTYVLFVLNGLRENDLYPGLPHAANYVIAALYIVLALAVAVYMHTEYYDIRHRARRRLEYQRPRHGRSDDRAGAGIFAQAPSYRCSSSTWH